jgi:hypothetical protein
MAPKKDLLALFIVTKSLKSRNNPELTHKKEVWGSMGTL